MNVTAIAWVSSPRAEPLDNDCDLVTCTITLDAQQFTEEALEWMQEFPHLEVVYLFDRHDAGSVQTADRHPRGN